MVSVRYLTIQLNMVKPKNLYMSTYFLENFFIADRKKVILEYVTYTPRRVALRLIFSLSRLRSLSDKKNFKMLSLGSKV